MSAASVSESLTAQGLFIPPVPRAPKPISHVKSMHSIRTPARDAIMKREYENGAEIDDIVRMLNELPGAEVYARSISSYVYAIKAYRPRWYIRLAGQRARNTQLAAKRQETENITILCPEGVSPTIYLPPVAPPKGGEISISALMLSQDAQTIGVAPTTQKEALEWGTRNGVRDPVTLARVNALRKHYSLPVFVVRNR